MSTPQVSLVSEPPALTIETLLSTTGRSALIQYCDQTLYEPSLDPELLAYLLVAYLIEQQVEAGEGVFLAANALTPQKTRIWEETLRTLLEAASHALASESRYADAIQLRQYLLDIDSTDLANRLHLLRLLISVGQGEPSLLADLGFPEAFKNSEFQAIGPHLINEALKEVLMDIPFAEISAWFAEACQPFLPLPTYTQTLTWAACMLDFQKNQPNAAARLLEICVSIDPDNPDHWFGLASYYVSMKEYGKAIDASNHCCELRKKDSKFLQADASYGLLRTLVAAGGKHWYEAESLIQDHRKKLIELAESGRDFSQDIKKIGNRAFALGFFLPYFYDDIEKNQLIKNWLAQCSYTSTVKNAVVSQKARKTTARYPGSRLGKNQDTSTPLRVGFISSCMDRHSVGWLSRWVLKYYDREQLNLNLYFFLKPPGEFSEQYFISQATSYTYSENPGQIAERIFDDKIQILVDLDSVTLDSVCSILIGRPAPVQATWLGWDASGNPAVDYFIVDPYVLPENAQKYYRETLWRLPQTYIAVDGFETQTPTLRRDTLGISGDAIVYLCIQSGYKYRLEIAKLQIQILAEVPNSYLLIKCYAAKERVKEFFSDLALQLGVDPDRLRFLDRDESEGVHRANLMLADVALDTYPYNGATTTLETLWAAVPLVTWVGEQFSSRNSYAFLRNCGVEEGIAWTANEYVYWGIRYGTDSDLRRDVSWKLRMSRNRSPLWNARQFTSDLQSSFRSMWNQYISQS